MVITTQVRRAIRLLRPTVALLAHSGQKRLVVELASAGELPYVRPLLAAAGELAGLQLILMPRDPRDLEYPEVQQSLAPIADNFIVILRDDVLSLMRYIGFHGFLTSEQFSEPVVRPSICIFHGQPSKGITFTPEILERYDHFFHLGPLHRQALEEFVKENQLDTAVLPARHDIGYPKSDPVFLGDGTLSEPSALAALKPGDRVVMYAPAFNEYGTLRSIGLELIEALAGIEDTAVIVKLAPDSIGPLDNFYATGGIDWRRQIEALGRDNVVVATELDISPYIQATDVLVTDVSGVAYEFLVAGKPVVYYDCPEFYRNTVLPRHPQLSLAEVLSRPTMNAGRHLGTVVSSLDELAAAVCEARSPSRVDELRQQLLFHPGHATQAMLRTLVQLLKP